MAKSRLAKTLGITITSLPDQAKRYRSIAAVAKALAAIQHAAPPTLESIYEISKAFAPGKDTDKQNILDAVKDGLLTTKSSLEDIRNLRRDGQPTPDKQRKERRAAPASITTAEAEAMTDEQIIKQAKAQGVTSPDKQQEVVKQFRQAEAAQAAKVPTPTIINATPPTKIPSDETERAFSFRLEDMTFSDIKVEGTSITGRFTIKNVKKDHGKWPATLPAALLRAMQQANL